MAGGEIDLDEIDWDESKATPPICEACRELQQLYNTGLGEVDPKR